MQAQRDVANSARARSTAARSAFVPASGSHVHVFRPTCPFREKRSRTIGLAVTSPAEAHRSFHIGTRSAASERDGGAAETTSARRRVRPQRGRVCEAGEAGWGAKSESLTRERSTNRDPQWMDARHVDARHASRNHIVPSAPLSTSSGFLGDGVKFPGRNFCRPISVAKRAKCCFDM